MADWRNRITGLEYHSTRDLTPHPGNWRDHPKAQAEAMRGVLAEVGIADALLAYHSERNGGKLTVIDGHLRKELADTTWPVLVLDVSDAEADYILATHDPLAAMAQADTAALDALLDTVNSGEAAVRAMLADLAKDAGIFNTPQGDDPGPQVDKAAELQAKWQTATGQLWQLGEHRLICGDCTDAAVVARVMGGERAQLVVTSPPYPGADMWTECQESDYDRVERLNTLNKTALQVCWGILTDGGVACWNIQDTPAGNHGILTTTTTTTIAVKEIGYSIRGNIIWDKAIPHLPAPAFMRRPCVPNLTHEHILVLFKGDWQPREKNTGLSDEAKTWLAQGVWRVATESAKAIGHKAPFPVEIPLRLISLFCLDGDAVFDPFLGSGTTIIACQKLGRRCRAVEIEPGYVAVALERWATMTGQTPVLVTD